MKRWMLDALFIVLLVFIGSGMILNSSSKNDQNQISSSVGDFDDIVNGDGVVDDGYLGDAGSIKEYEGNGVAKIIGTISNGVISIVNGVVEFGLNTIKGVLN